MNPVKYLEDIIKKHNNAKTKQWRKELKSAVELGVRKDIYDGFTKEEIILSIVTIAKQRKYSEGIINIIILWANKAHERITKERNINEA